MSERIQRRIERAFALGKQASATGDQLRRAIMAEAMATNPPAYAHNIRRAQLDCALFDHYPIEIDPDELLVGRFADESRLTEEQWAWNGRYDELAGQHGRLIGMYPASTGHRVVDYEKLLSKGVKGVLAEIEEQAALIDYSRPEDAEKNAVYESMRLSLNGFCRFAARAKAELEKLYEAEEDPVRKAEYRVMADNFAKAPYEPCTHFYEALQIMWFLQFSLQLLSGDTSLTGRLDNYLYPFYKKDLEDGVLTKEFAFELIESLYLKHNEIYDAWPASIMVGGVKRDGTPNWNELSYMCIDAIGTVKLINPSVNVCWTKDMPADLMEKCMQLIADGYTRPAFFNDRLIQEGLRCAGMSEEDARYYIHSTCVEITPIGSSNVQVATPYINLNKAFEYILNGGRAMFGEECAVTPKIHVDLEALNTFEDFYALTKQVVSGIIRANLISTCQRMYQFSQYSASPLASAFLNDCIARGKDSGNGGARYSYVYPCFPGFLNLVDALAAIEETVYEKKLLTLNEMGDLMRGNFEGGERMRQYLINRCPKIGNGIEKADRFGVELFELIRHELMKYKTSIGGAFHPSYFAWIMHGHLGRLAAATPDGRRQGEALSECLGAVQGMDKNGPTGVLRSIEKIDQKYGIGGIATNLRFSQKMMRSEEGKQAVSRFIETFMDHDCFEVQFNVVDQKALLDAKENPEKHKTLMVRVAGYSDYFVNLAPNIQDEIIKRSEYDGI